MDPSSRTIRVLIADDHKIVRAGVRQFLEQAKDIEIVAEAEDGEQAKRLLEGTIPDVAVLDIQMPKATGIEVARWSKAKYPQVGILILTAYDDQPYVSAVMEAGANGYILKTADPLAVVDAVREVYEGRNVVAAEIAQRQFSPTQMSVRASLEALTERELQTLSLASKGFTNKAIAAQLQISDRTVQGHLAHIFAKLEVSGRTEAVMRAISLGWIANDFSVQESD